MYNHNKAQQSKKRVHISWDILNDLRRDNTCKIDPHQSVLSSDPLGQIPDKRFRYLHTSLLEHF